MLKHTILLALTLSGTLYCSAYIPIKFSMPADTFISDKNICKNLRVIDMRQNKEQIGAMSFRSIDKMEIKLTAEGPLPGMISRYFDSISQKHKGEYELLLVMHDFWIMKKLNDMDFGHFYFSGDFYIGKDGRYTMLDSVSELYELNASKHLIEKLMITARHAMFQFFNTYATTPVDARSFTLSEDDARNRRERIKDQYPVYAGNFKKGIYYTVDQFLANTPADTAIVVNEDYIDERRRLYYYYHKNEKGKAGKKIHVEEFFAIYDGKRWHAGGEHGKKKMLFENGAFIAVRSGLGIVTPYRRSQTQSIGMASMQSGMMGGGLLGGVIGAVAGQLIASGVSNKVKDRKKMVKAYYVCRFDPAKKEYVAIEREIMY